MPDAHRQPTTRHNSREVRADAIRLRPVVPGNLPALFQMQLDPEANDMAGTKPRTRDAFFAAWERHLADPGVSARVIEIDGAHGPEIVGSVGRHQADGHDCVGYWIARAHWGKGVASRALMMFLAEERRRPLHATSARNNAPSQRILEKCGFRCVGFRMEEETERFLAREIADFVLE
ncbi:MAG TPA: GNAT family N-acetyltransferase [Phycisphaerae bacterium]|nr:GNAT family N-acetyltransferase [Phycisphaerae bacterium]